MARRNAEGDQTEMIARFQKGARAQYEAAIVELVVHATFRRLGHIIDVHPDSPPPSRRPDFLVRDINGLKLAYVEVTTFGPDAKVVTRDNQEADIYNGLETVDLPAGWLLGYNLQQHGKVSPSIKKLKRDVEGWAREVCGEDDTQMPSRVFEAGDWQIELTAIGGFRKDKKYERKIGAAVRNRDRFLHISILGKHLNLRAVVTVCSMLPISSWSLTAKKRSQHRTM